MLKVEIDKNLLLNISNKICLDEYVWHANRPVNMILATGVQLPNVLTESAVNTNLESEQFFSNIIEEIINDYQKRHPSDHYSALKQWKQRHVSHYLQ